MATAVSAPFRAQAHLRQPPLRLTPRIPFPSRHFRRLPAPAARRNPRLPSRQLPPFAIAPHGNCTHIKRSTRPYPSCLSPPIPNPRYLPPPDSRPPPPVHPSSLILHPFPFIPNPSPFTPSPLRPPASGLQPPASPSSLRSPASLRPISGFTTEADIRKHSLRSEFRDGRIGQTPRERASLSVRPPLPQESNVLRDRRGDHPRAAALLLRREEHWA